MGRAGTARASTRKALCELVSKGDGLIKVLNRFIKALKGLIDELIGILN
jgi:predicted NBD/HSP70 family sugar kinase